MSEFKVGDKVIQIEKPFKGEKDFGNEILTIRDIDIYYQYINICSFKEYRDVWFNLSRFKRWNLIEKLDKILEE
jgi:hypothetical protein